jgi:hypothetical protein
LLVGRPVLPPPMMPPPTAGSCWAIAILAHANKQMNTEREIRGKRQRVNIKFSPANQTAIEVRAERLRTAAKHYSAKTARVLIGDASLLVYASVNGVNPSITRWCEW